MNLKRLNQIPIGREVRDVESVKINAADLECRCACLQKSERQATRRPVLSMPGRHRRIPAECEPTSLQVVRRRTTTQRRPPAPPRWASITLPAEAPPHQP